MPEIDRYHTTRTATCDKGHEFRQTQNPCKDNRYEPQTCPTCDHEVRRAEQDRVLRENSDLKKKPSDPFEEWCATPEGERSLSGQAYGPYLKQRLHLAFEAGRRA